MAVQTKQTDILIAGGIALFFLVIGLIGWWLLGPIMAIISLSIALFLVFFVHIEYYHKTVSQRYDYKQIEALHLLLSHIKPVHPLPPMRMGAISPDCANLLISFIYEHKPKVILECGSGVSTLLTSYCLKDIGEGHVFSLEHDEKYTEISKGYLKNHGLEDKVTIIYAPLKEITLSGNQYIWYDTSFLQKLNKIDMMVIDGPPSSIHKMVRYPALPLLEKYLNENAVIFIDDGKRKEEKQIVKKWLKEFSGFDYRWHNTEKGTVVLMRKA